MPQAPIIGSTVLRAAVVAILAWATPIGAAYALVPPIQFFAQTTPSNSEGVKIAVAQCPAGTTVLGGGGFTTGADGEVVIQAAFPMFDVGLMRNIFVVKATESEAGTPAPWSVTAHAYCTVSDFGQRIVALSAYDYSPTKSVTVQCPRWTEVAGMGGEVSRLPDEPRRLTSSMPPASVVFQGFEVNADRTEVTAWATEVGAAIGADPYGGQWQVAAVAYCIQPAYYNGLERNEYGHSSLNASDSVVSVGCTPGKQIVATGSTVDDSEMGQWYLDRVSAYSILQNRAVGEATRHEGLTSVTQTIYSICVDKK
jgi:hypothetical protein